MNTKLAAGLLSLSSTLAFNSFAEETSVTIIPQIGIQYKDLSFDQNIKSSDDSLRGSGGFSEGLLSLTGSVTGALDKFFVTLKADQTLNATNTDSTAPYAVDTAEIKRTDFTVTLAYNVWQTINVFAGYIRGETTIAPKGGGTSSGAIDGSLADLEANYEQTYEEKGWFTGASYGWDLGDPGFVSATIAYASMDGKYSDNFSVAPFKYEGDSDGISLGVTWSYPVTAKFRCYTDLRYQKYDMSAKDKTGTFAGTKVDTEEKITALTIGVLYLL
jgi:hypothetical protein